MSAEQKFDAGVYRYDAAAYVKALLTAREHAEPGFVTADMHRKWDLKEDFPGISGVYESLKFAKTKLDMINVILSVPGGSLGYGKVEEGAIGDIQIAVSGLVDGELLSEAIRAARNDQPIDWDNLVRWDKLDAIREGLDLLPHPRQSEEKSDLAAAIECHVTLSQMAAIVNKRKKTLERLRDNGKLSAPAVKGGSGRADEWRWSDVRPILQDEYNRQLPEIYPADRFILR